MENAPLPNLPVGLRSSIGRTAQPQQRLLIASEVTSSVVELVNSIL